jgi:dTDP-4-dehydrorhamnose reductase
VANAGNDSGRLLIVGGDSLVGGVLAGHFADHGWTVSTTTRRRGPAAAGHLHLDLADPNPDALANLPAADAAVLVAAVSRIGDCETAPEASWNVNVVGTLRVAEALAERGSHLILLSSDKVFDGSRPRRRRQDTVCPACEYGRQKAAAETGVLGLGDRGAVLRLSKVLEPSLDLLAGWRAELAAGRPIAPFHDLYLAPVTATLVARLVRRIAADRAAGIFQCTGREDRSYVDLARRLADDLGADPSLVAPTSCHQAGLPEAARPCHTTLEMTEEQARWGLTPPPFDAVVDEIIGAPAPTTAA